MKIDTLYTSVSFINSIVPILFGLLFLMLSIPDCPELQLYKRSRKAMSWIYISIGLITLGEIFSKRHCSSGEHVLIIKSTLAIASFQAFLFTYICILLINSSPIIRKRLDFHLIPIISFFLLVILSVIIKNNLFDKIIIASYTAFYTYQLIYYTHRFLSQEKEYRNKAENYFSGDEASRLHWVRTVFLSALSIGIGALFLIIFPYDWCNIIFSITCIIFYFFFAIKFLNYPQEFYVLRPIIVPALEPNKVSSFNGFDLSLKINQWINDKGYTAHGVTIINVAKILNTNRTYLSSHINSQTGMNFNMWINQLRIQESQRLMIEYPEKSLSFIAEKLGYSEISSFSRQFLKFTGTSPSVWKKSNSQAYS